MISHYKKMKNITKEMLKIQHPLLPNGYVEVGAGRTVSIPTPIWAAVSRRYQDKLVSPDSPSYKEAEEKTQKRGSK